MGELLQMIGCDIIDVSRFRKYNLEDSFITRTFSATEIEYCKQKKDPYPHLAGRFAAKEAVTKALCAQGESIDPSTISIEKNKQGVPIVALRSHPYEALLTISHTSDQAIAFCQLRPKQNI